MQRIHSYPSFLSSHPFLSFLALPCLALLPRLQLAGLRSSFFSSPPQIFVNFAGHSSRHITRDKRNSLLRRLRHAFLNTVHSVQPDFCLDSTRFVPTTQSIPAFLFYHSHAHPVVTRHRLNRPASSVSSVSLLPCFSPRALSSCQPPPPRQLRFRLTRSKLLHQHPSLDHR